MIIEKKILPKYFQKIIDGDKTFELRLADFNCQEGDTLVLKEYDGKEFTGREMKKEVTYVLKTKDINFWPEEKVKEFGYQIISFK